MIDSIYGFGNGLIDAHWWTAGGWPVVWSLIKIVCVLLPLLGAVAYLTLWERKFLGWIQVRHGPNRVGPWGLLQPIADALKLLTKEIISPSAASPGLFRLGPIMAIMPALAAWVAIPFGPEAVLANVNAGLLLIMAITSIEVYGVIIAGWASNSKYAFLGAMRSAAQMVSYEVSIGFVMVSVLLCVGSLNLTDIVLAQKKIWFCLPLFPMFIVFFISALAETNRPPFDLPEAESELVAGFAVEYSSTPYLLFMLGEYVAITTMCALTTIMFLGGWLPPADVWPLNLVSGFVWFMLKVVFVFFMFAMVKAFVPRYRYDQLMRLGWKVFLPISLAMVVIVAAFLKITGFA